MNHFGESLAASHAAEDLPIWNEIYRKAFPGVVGIHNHRQDGDHQRQGIDRSLVLDNGKRLWVDEKVRFRNKITGKVYDDIALEYMSDRKRQTLGWVCKPLLCDYIAYAIAPLGKCYLMPVLQLQQAWGKNSDDWLKKYKTIEAHNEWRGNSWTTLSCCVPPAVIFPEIGKCLRVTFEEYEAQEAA